MMDWKSDFAQFAREELPVETAERLIGMLRPAIRLSAAEDGEIVVGRLGGVARLPSGTAWPSRTDGWPMSFVAELDCGALTRYEVDIVLPDTGTLLFFLARFHDLGADFYDTRIKPDRRKRNHVRQLEALGYRVILEPAA